MLSGISGGALLGALYAYGPDRFDDFDAEVVELLRDGLQMAIARRLLLSRRLGQALLSSLSLPPAAVADVVAHRLGRNPSPRIRQVNRTTAFADVLAALRFGDMTMQQVTRAGLDVVLTACDLATGSAVRFGSAVSSCSRLGDLLEPVRVANAVAASAAFPALLPALERRTVIRGRDGAVSEHVLLLTDGGVYDNLGTTVLEPGRGTKIHLPRIRRQVRDRLRRRAGARPNPQPARLADPDETRSGHHALPCTAGRTHPVVHCEGKRQAGRDGVRLPRNDRPAASSARSGLVSRSAVADYPTNFAAIDSRSLTALTTRGEQLTRLLISHYCPE